MSNSYDLPLRVQISKNKSFILNLNNYRNAHYQALNKAKQSYYDLIKHNFVGLELRGQITIEFTLYQPTKRLCDVANICSIVDKFACDSLVKSGCILDDNYKFIPAVMYSWGGVDKENPRCEMRINELMCGERWIETGNP